MYVLGQQAVLFIYIICVCIGSAGSVYREVYSIAGNVAGIKLGKSHFLAFVKFYLADCTEIILYCPKIILNYS